MHFCVAVITEEKPTDKVIEEVLVPYWEGLEVDAYIDEDGEETTYNPDSKWDWYEIGGRWRDILGRRYVQVKDYPRDYSCYAILNDGEWIESGLPMFASKEEGKGWNSEFNELLDSLPQDYYVTVVDCHI